MQKTDNMSLHTKDCVSHCVYNLPFKNHFPAIWTTRLWFPLVVTEVVVPLTFTASEHRTQARVQPIIPGTVCPELKWPDCTLATQLHLVPMLVLRGHIPYMVKVCCWIMIWYINCNWFDTPWQWYSTHLHTNNTQNNTMKQNTQNRTYKTNKNA